MRLKRSTSIAILSGLLLAQSAQAYQFESRDDEGNIIRTCDRDQPCETMPNPDDLNGLQLRQTLGSFRQVILYSPDHTFSCLINDGSWTRPTRIGREQMPETISISSAGTIRFECTDESVSQTLIFFVPAVEYLVPLKR